MGLQQHDSGANVCTMRQQAAEEYIKRAQDLKLA